MSDTTDMARMLGRLLGMIDWLEQAQKYDERFSVPGYTTQDVVEKLIAAKREWDQGKRA